MTNCLNEISLLTNGSSFVNWSGELPRQRYLWKERQIRSCIHEGTCWKQWFPTREHPYFMPRLYRLLLPLPGILVTSTGKDDQQKKPKCSTIRWLGWRTDNWDTQFRSSYAPSTDKVWKTAARPEQAAFVMIVEKDYDDDGRSPVQ